MEPRADHRGALAGGSGEDQDRSGTVRVLKIDEGAVPRLLERLISTDSRTASRYTVELLGIGLAYFVFAKLGLTLASINPSATPIWPPTGLALAAVLLWGYRICPAIFLAALLANATTAGSIYTSSAIALGNTLECVVGGYLINRWSDSVGTFDTPAGVARFALISFVAATPISATVGVGSLSLAGYAEGTQFASIWITWWLGDLAGALVITPVVVLWATSHAQSFNRKELVETGLVFAGAIVVGIIAFGPLIEQTTNRVPWGFLAVLPLIWAALRRGQRDTATVALILSCFAVWGTMSDGGPFAQETLNESFLLLLMFMISTSVPSLALSANVTERERGEEALRESEARYRNVVETQTELICRFLPDTTLTFVNDAYCRYFERTRDGLIGTKFIGLIPDPARAATLQYIESLMKSPRIETHERQVLRPDGSTGWQQWIDRVILDRHGQVVEIQGIGRDITELKRAELEAQEHRKEVTHLTRVAIIGELSSALAHELNQPLTAILSNAQAAQRLLAREPVDLAEVREILKDIVEDDQRAGEVIRRARALLKKGDVQFQPLDINAIISEVLELAHSELIERHVAVTTRLAPDLPTARGDRVQLQQVLLNLIMNASEAMSTNETVHPVLTVSTAVNAAGSVQVSIADTGGGVPAQIADHLFEPFFTTKEHGLGLGLPISHSIIAAHGGRLWPTNNADHGATFHLTLPAQTEGEA